MKRFIFSIILFIAANSLAEEPLAGVRADSFNLLKTLLISDFVKNSPEEFNSFKSTVDAAEELHQRGEITEAAKLFTLANLKGKLLLQNKKAATTLTSIDREPSRSVFKSISSLAPVNATQTPQLTETSTDITAYEPPAEGRISKRIIGGEGIYTVRKGDNLRLIASRLGVRLRDLARVNRLKTDAMLFAGEKLKYNNRRILPKSIRNGIVVNIPDRNLYLFRNGRLFASYPVALGISKKKESTAWRTPVGRFRIVDKKENPTWRIPISIQKEMEENGEEVLEFVPPGPKNPLGKYAMRTTLAGILIHSTTRPSSINSYSSHGCIRVMPEHMERLFKAVSVPMQGEIVYQPVKVEVTPGGRVFLEVNRDSYEQIEDMALEVTRIISRYRAENRVSWQRVKKVVNEKSGIAEEVSLAEIPD
jgi:lipoprotein-anchoring transpeptidase ErfK/SrfK